MLLSCSITDFGIWTNSDKNVVKQKTTSRCCCCAWTNDGQMFAIGFADGTVHIRKITNINDEPHVRIERGSEPVWALSFSITHIPSDMAYKNSVEESIPEILTISDWNKTLAFYDTNGAKLITKDKHLNYTPNCMRYFNNGQFLVIGGTNKQLNLYTRYGLPLGTICQMDTWVWSVAAKPNSTIVVVGCVDGTIACYTLMFSTVHGLHQERYAFRDNMTEVIVQHLSKHTMARIRCNDLVKKVAVFGEKLAVQLSDKLHIYRQVSGENDNEQLEYKLVEKINKAFDCSLLVVCHHHIILCHEQNLQCYDQKGIKQREWVLQSNIRYIKVIGGPPGKETILVGLKAGQVCKIFVDNPFPLQLIQLKSAVRCIDINFSRTRIAVVDEENLCQVYDARSKECIFQEPNCNSVAFNNDNEDVICYSGGTTLTIKASTFPGHQQRMMGFVVGFSGNKVFCLHLYHMSAVEVPFTAQLYQYMEHKLFNEAYRIACLGVTEDEWQALATESLQNLELEIAAKAFARLKDYKMLHLIHEIKEMIEAKEPEVLIKANILAYENRYKEVAALYRDHGYENKAMELFTDLKMFDEAQEIMSTATGETQKMLMRKRADWAKNSNQPKVAAEMLIASGDYDKAVDLIADNDWMDLAINVMRKLDRSDLDTLRKLANYFIQKNDYSLAAKIYTSINDIKSMVDMHVNAGHWTDAFALADHYPKYVEDVYIPYARHLAEQDRFDEAQRAYHKAGRDQEALWVLEQLTSNAVNEKRYADAGYYNWMLANQYMERAQDKPDLISKYRECIKLADIYYAYHQVFLFCNQPFTSLSLETLLNTARFLSFQPSIGYISRVMVYFAIARIGRDLGAYKLCRDALDKLTQLKVPTRLQRSVDIMTITIRAKPFTDSEDLLPMCYRCGLNNPMTSELTCVHCKTPFIFCYSTFDILPLVEFYISDDISKEEVLELIDAEPPLSDSIFNPFHGKKKEAKVILDKDGLSRLERGHVIILDQPLMTRYLFNVMPTISIAKCPTCFKLFSADDYEMAVLQKNQCPYCRTPQAQSSDSLMFDDD
ncbi:hypothetical protein WR25_12873 [Diploscapter pachys]|uniref:Intraflagellar transport protein 122 homolog n=1 Tax=Diploscapter pachys TaxID=2018661 RepID=A0A2A2KTF1_9BILA|nr:hypothetical protein WR25_12873 [Diploscapter pachys]